MVMFGKHLKVTNLNNPSAQKQMILTSSVTFEGPGVSRVCQASDADDMFDLESIQSMPAADTIAHANPETNAEPIVRASAEANGSDNKKQQTNKKLTKKAKKATKKKKRVVWCNPHNTTHKTTESVFLCALVSIA